MTVTNQNIKIMKKIFLNRDRAIPLAQVTSVSRHESDLEVASSSANSLGSGTT